MPAHETAPPTFRFETEQRIYDAFIAHPLVAAATVRYDDDCYTCHVAITTTARVTTHDRLIFGDMARGMRSHCENVRVTVIE